MRILPPKVIIRVTSTRWVHGKLTLRVCCFARELTCYRLLAC